MKLQNGLFGSNLQKKNPDSLCLTLQNHFSLQLQARSATPSKPPHKTKKKKKNPNFKPFCYFTKKIQVRWFGQLVFIAELLHHCELFPVPAGGCNLHYQFRPCLSYVSFFVSILNQNPQPEIGIIRLGTELTMDYHYILMTVSRESSFQVWTLGTGRWLINRSEGEILVMFQVDQRVTWYFLRKPLWTSWTKR